MWSLNISIYNWQNNFGTEFDQHNEPTERGTTIRKDLWNLAYYFMNIRCYKSGIF